MNFKQLNFMVMRKPIVLCAILALLFASCGKIRNRLDELENRMDRLEELCAQMNTNIGSLQTIVTALQEQDYVTGVVPITQGEQEIGYTITFAKASPVTIYQNGAAETPEIGVKRDEDGVYYWTLGREWLTDEEGKQLRAEGITPQMCITDGYWEVSYDGGASWIRAGKATGENGADGEPGGDSIFKSVTQDERNVTFRLQNGQEIILPKSSALIITFSEESPLAFEINETKTISYEVKGGNEHNVAKAEILNDDGSYTIRFEPETATSGKLTITAKVPTDCRIIVSVSDGKTTIMVPLDLEMKPLKPSIDKDVVTISEPGTLASLLEEYEPASITKLTIVGNLNESDFKTLNSLPNLTELDLSKTSVKNIPANAFKDNKSLKSIVFPENLKVIGREAFYHCYGLRGYLTIPKGVTSIEERAFCGCSGFIGNLTIPENVTLIGKQAFSGCSGFTGKLVIPESVTSIERQAFEYCSNLTSLVIPESVTLIDEQVFMNCTDLTGELVIPKSVTSIGSMAFSGCASLTSLVITDGVTSIEGSAFSNCRSLTGELVIPESVTSIGSSAFFGCHFTGDFVIPSAVTSIGNEAFSSCGLTGKCYCKCTTPPYLGNSVFPENMERILYVPIGCAEKYRTADGWKDIDWKEINEMEF